MLGVITVGNATLVAMDGDPVLATDPWLGDEDEAYFGSWTLSHAIPPREKALIAQAAYHWYSHGHPDHLNPRSLDRFARTPVLLPDHVGSRIKRALEALGREVKVLPERTWVQLSKRVRVMSISDYIQDAILLVDVNGTLFVDANDAGVRACRRFIKRIAREYDRSHLLRLAGHGDADMINIFSEDGQRVPHPEALQVGKVLSDSARALGCNHVIPFSSFHRYQRADSIWAQDYTTPLAAFAVGFDRTEAELLPPFVFVDCEKEGFVELEPPELPAAVLAPERFGDDWSERLEPADSERISRYFRRFESLRTWYGFLNVTVGGVTHTIGLDGPERRGITFEAPRNSLMVAIANETFDDLLIGNFMKTTFHGVHSLYEPNFNFVVAKWGDNGRAHTLGEVDDYLGEYAARAQGEWLLHRFEARAVQTLRRYVSQTTGVYAAGSALYRYLK